MSVTLDLKVLGVKKTLILLIGRRIKKRIPKSKRIDLSPKVCKHPFYVRLNSSDTDVLQSIFLERQYGGGGILRHF